MTYQLNLGQFSGPLDKLLELIEARQLEITEISLAQVTDDFLRYLETLKKAAQGEDGSLSDLRLLADFVVVASRLLFIKSKSLLPDLPLTGEEEVEIKDLESRLKIYKEFRPAMKILRELWVSDGREFSRPYFLTISTPFKVSPRLAEGLNTGGTVSASRAGVFYPGSKLSVSALAAALRDIFEDFQKLMFENRVLRDTIVSLEQKINEIIEKFKKLTEVSFNNLSGAIPRSEIIVTFLAILHLAREQLVFLEQENYLSDIIIKKT